LAWGALVFGEFAGQGAGTQALVIAGSLIMIGGAAAISMAEAPELEQRSWRTAMKRECDRYGLDEDRVAQTLEGADPLARERPKRRWWELLIGASALAFFIWLAAGAQSQMIAMSVPWMVVLIGASIAVLVFSGLVLWRRTRFS
jgi:hypothetical protein